MQIASYQNEEGFGFLSIPNHSYVLKKIYHCSIYLFNFDFHRKSFKF